MGKPRKLGKKRRRIATEQLEAAQLAQEQFWSALSDLEATLGVEIEGTAELANMDVDDLLEVADA
jgi:hypothetical protein